jgi:antirestriction protein
MTKVILNDHVNSNNPTPSVSTPPIYLAVATYRQGKFCGRWIDLPQEMERIHYEVQQRLSDNPTPTINSFIIHDLEALGSLEPKLYENIESLQEKMMSLLDRKDLGVQLLTYFHGEINLATEALHDHYRGAYDSELEYAIHFFNNHYLENTPEEVQDSIDYTLFWEAIFNHDYFSLEAEGQFHVFSRQ